MGIESESHGDLYRFALSISSHFSIRPELIKVCNLEPDYPYLEALAPFQPIAMKAVHCAIDTSLNFTQANKLIRELKPSTLILPECYTQPPVSHPSRTELVIEQVQ